MEAVLFIGIQASGKSTFYKQRFFDTHLRISRDQLKTRHRERMLCRFCLETGQPFVVDKMNQTAGHRAFYIAEAKKAHFRVIGYFFVAQLEDCLTRNAQRSGRQRIPDYGIRGTAASLEPPRYEEGFDELYRVQMDGQGGFAVEPWDGE